MKTLKTFSILLLLLFSISCSNQKKETYSIEIKNEIDTYLSETMKLHNIPGLALGIVSEGNVIYKKYFGIASLENNVQVDKSTLFRVFSATKLITSTGIFQLVQDEKLNLDDPIAKYIGDLPLHWQEIKVENLLTHSSGLPDMVRYKSTLSDRELMEQLAKDKMDFATGDQFRYNQTNYWLLAQIIEKVTGMSFDEYILKNQFNSSKNGVLFSSNSQEIIPNRAVRYFYNGKTKEFEKDTNNSRKRGHAGNGLNITLDKFIEWSIQLDNHQLLDRKTKIKMWTPFKFSNQKDDFLHGWRNYPVNGLKSYGFSGGNLAAFRKFADNKTTIILLSNGYKIPAYDIIVNDIARIVIPKIKGSTLEEDVMSYTIKMEFDKAAQSFKKLKEENPHSNFDNLKWNINSIGNSFTYKNELQKAFQVFKFNADTNPKWWVSLAGLAEIYEMRKDTINALTNYQKAIALNKNNEWNYNEQMKNKIAKLKK